MGQWIIYDSAYFIVKVKTYSGYLKICFYQKHTQTILIAVTHWIVLKQN